MRYLVALGAALCALGAAAPSPAGAAPCIPPPVTDDPPPAAVLSTFALLRTPATLADAWPRTDLLPPDTSFYRRWFRLARSLDGYRFFLLPGHEGCGGPSELFIGALGSRSSVQGGARLGVVRRFAEWIAQGYRGGSLVAGLLPDGVAKVTLTYPAGRGHPGGIDYPRAVRRTVRVRHNMAVFRFSRPPDDAASPSRQVWRSKSGRVIRRAPGNP